MYRIAYFDSTSKEFLGWYAPNRAKFQVLSKKEDEAHKLPLHRAQEIASCVVGNKTAEVQPA